MAWYKVDDRLPTSRKVLRIPRDQRAAAIGVWTLAGAWSAHDLTDGFIPAYMIEEWGGSDVEADALVRAGLWEVSEDDGDEGFQFVNWGEYQPLKGEVEADREKARERKRRQRRGSNGEFAGQAHVTPVSHRDTPVTPAVEVRDATVPGPSRPVPSPTYVGVPDGWKPNRKHYDYGKEIGVYVKDEAEKFKKHAAENDRDLKNVNLAFTNWLKKLAPEPTPNDLLWGGGVRL